MTKLIENLQADLKEVQEELADARGEYAELECELEKVQEQLSAAVQGAEQASSDLTVAQARIEQLEGTLRTHDVIANTQKLAKQIEEKTRRVCAEQVDFIATGYSDRAPERFVLIAARQVILSSGSVADVNPPAGAAQ